MDIRESLQEYSIELKSLALKILNLIAEGLGMKHEEIEVLFEEGLQSMRLNYYPPCPQPELVTGLCHHSDPIGLTILLQINDVQGLQMKENEAWVRVLPLPNAFIVNVGDILEVQICINIRLY
ncbi:oxoglutarate-dependent flavonoid 7-O-demethylase 1-like [Coffea arabica]|uniref:Oxoglutarate-dependent flavonoid 7-O-demethylase 1-like n=1 Tax=Coffea arabica TaxID=13443 RepID=A0ABM4VPD2_COFAR